MGARTICQKEHGSAVPLLKAPLTHAGRGGYPLRTPLFPAFSLPYLASGQELSVERKQGKGVVTGFPGGAPSPSLPRSAGEGPLQASPLARKLLHDKSCVHPQGMNLP
jgi:hypothetical protein